MSNDFFFLSKAAIRSFYQSTSSPRGSKYHAVLETDIRAGSISKCWSCCARRNQVASHPLKSAFEQRIEELGLLLNGSIIESLAINVAAVLEGHKLGDLLWLDGQYYVFVEGRRVAGPRPISDSDPQQVLWEEFPNPRSAWLEVVDVIQIQPFQFDMEFLIFLEKCRGRRHLLSAFRQTIYCSESGHHRDFTL